jgi:GR25 family glycosyltransferase involved in LPS biosynthesis
MAYVPPHRRQKKTPPPGATTTTGTTTTSDATSDRVVPQTAVVGSTPRPRTPPPYDGTITTTAHQPPVNKARHRHPWPTDNDAFQKDDYSNDWNDDDDSIDLVCAVLTRICCINLQQRPDKWQRVLQKAQHVHERFASKVERFEAVQGDHADDIIVNSVEESQVPVLVQREWNATQNAQYCSRVKTTNANTGGADDYMKTMTDGEVGCALSHIKLWQQLAVCSSNSSSTTTSTTPDKTTTTCMLILEDDVFFTCSKQRGNTSRFARAFAKAWNMLPSDWSILYLGFSSRGERIYVNNNIIDEGTTTTGLASVPTSNNSRSSNFQRRQRSNNNNNNNPLDPEIRLYRPTYGFHTHAYVINKTGAAKLLENLPVVGPIDVWLADNAWFGLHVYCAVIAHEGWRSEDGTLEGTNLVSQDRNTQYRSDIPQSAHAAYS